jgi:hypothetical protein
MRTSEKKREKKSPDKKKNREKKEKKSLYMCMSIYLACFVRMVIGRNHYQDLTIHKRTIILLTTLVNYIDAM